MKKIILVLAIAFVGCSQDNDLPEPIELDVATVVTSQYNFEGSWDCYDWIVDDITGAMKHRRFVFSEQDGNDIRVTLNEYDSNGSMTQLLHQSSAFVDSSYFDESINPLGMSFKGVLTTDTTLMVYQYYTSGLSVDTSQVKEFVKH